MSNAIKIFCLYMVMINTVAMAKSPNWHDHQVQVGEQVFHIKLPTKESKDFLREEVLQQVSLTDPRLDAENKGYAINAINKYWDFYGGLFQGVLGTLSLKVRIKKTTPDFDGDISNPEMLKNQLTTRMKVANIQIPVDFNHMSINGVDWVSFDDLSKEKYTFYGSDHFG